MVRVKNFAYESTSQVLSDKVNSKYKSQILCWHERMIIWVKNRCDSGGTVGGLNGFFIVSSCCRLMIRGDAKKHTNGDVPLKEFKSKPRLDLLSQSLKLFVVLVP